jgi:hypothetical protein
VLLAADCIDDDGREEAEEEEEEEAGAWSVSMSDSTRRLSLRRVLGPGRRCLAAAVAGHSRASWRPLCCCY